MADYAGAIEMYNTNAFVGRNGLKPRYVLLHGTAGGASAQAIAAFFQSTQGTGNPVSANYVVGQDGAVVQCNPESDGAWANGYLSSGHDAFWDTGVNPNLVTVSIEHVKSSSDNSDALTPAQQAASFKLVADICQRWNVPAQWANAQGGITGHYSIDPVNRSRCPGPYPWDQLFAYLQQGASMNTTPPQGWPIGWSDDGHTLTAPNGHKVVGGFRNYIYTNFWDNDDYPLEEEHPVAPLELGNTGLGNGTQQIFRKSILEVVTGQGIIKMWTGQEVQASRKALADQQAKLVAVQNAYNAVVTEKNGLIGQVNDLKTQLAAESNVNVTLLQQQNTSLQNKINQAKAALA